MCTRVRLRYVHARARVLARARTCLPLRITRSIRGATRIARVQTGTYNNRHGPGDDRSWVEAHARRSCGFSYELPGFCAVHKPLDEVRPCPLYLGPSKISRRGMPQVRKN